MSRQWLEYADDDLEPAQYMLGLYPLKLEIICFHCQQGAEKSLKAYLVNQETEFPRTHDLVLLQTLCEEFLNEFGNIKDECARLTPYAVQPRYPMEIVITEADMRQALLDANSIQAFVRQRINAQNI